MLLLSGVADLNATVCCLDESIGHRREIRFTSYVLSGSLPRRKRCYALHIDVLYYVGAERFMCLRDQGTMPLFRLSTCKPVLGGRASTRFRTATVDTRSDNIVTHHISSDVVVLRHVIRSTPPTEELWRARRA